MAPPRPGLKFSREEMRTLRRIGFRSRSRKVYLKRSELGRVLYSKKPPFVPTGQGLVLGEHGMEGLFFFADRGTMRRRRYQDVESIFPYPPRDWSGPSRAHKGKRTSQELMFPGLEGLQFETFDAEVLTLELRGHHTDIIMAILQDRLDDRWEEVFQGAGGKELPPSYWGRYHKLIYVEPGREWME